MLARRRGAGTGLRVASRRADWVRAVQCAALVVVVLPATVITMSSAAWVAAGALVVELSV